MVQCGELRSMAVAILGHQRRPSRRVRAVEGIGLLPRLKRGTKLRQKTSLEEFSQISLPVDLSFQPLIDVGRVILPLLIAAHRKCFGFYPQPAGTSVKLALSRIPTRSLIAAPRGSTRDKCPFNP